MTTSLRPLRRMPDGVRKTAGDPLEIGKHPIAPLVAQTVERIGEKRIVIHEVSRLRGRLDGDSRKPFLESFQRSCRATSRGKIVAQRLR